MPGSRPATSESMSYVGSQVIQSGAAGGHSDFHIQQGYHGETCTALFLDDLQMSTIIATGPTTVSAK